MRLTLPKKIAVALSLVTLLVVSLVVSAQSLPISKSPEGAMAYIISPKDGDTVGTEVTVVFGLTGMGVAPAGIEMENTGHHHLLVDQKELPEAGKPIGNPPLHFGKGQTETTLTLEPGTHTLQLILGNHLHIPHDPPVVSEMITITVE